MRAHKRLQLVETSRDLTLTLELANGSRIVALCGDGDGFRGFSDPRLCLIDEASVVDDSVLDAFLPMLLVSGGRLIALSTPRGGTDSLRPSGRKPIRLGPALRPVRRNHHESAKRLLPSNGEAWDRGCSLRSSSSHSWTTSTACSARSQSKTCSARTIRPQVYPHWRACKWTHGCQSILASSKITRPFRCSFDPSRSTRRPAGLSARRRDTLAIVGTSSGSSGFPGDCVRSSG